MVKDTHIQVATQWFVKGDFIRILNGVVSNEQWRALLLFIESHDKWPTMNDIATQLHYTNTK